MQKISSSITRKRLILVSALTVILWIGWKMAATRSNHIFSSSSSSSPSSALPTAEQNEGPNIMHYWDWYLPPLPPIFASEQHAHQQTISSTSSETHHQSSEFPLDSESISSPQAFGFPSTFLHPSAPPLRNHVQRHRYISIELYSGLNNARMQLEPALVLAHVLNRTLVLQPPLVLPHHRSASRIEDYFDLAQMRKAIRVLTSEEFCDEVGIDQRVHKQFGSFQAWGEFMERQALSSDILQQNHAVTVPDWDMDKQIVCIPSLAACNAASNAEEFRFPTFHQFLRGRHVLELSDSHFNVPHIHFRTRYNPNKVIRLFGQFYAFFYFADVRWHSFYVQLVRKYLHYRPVIADAAGLFVQRMLTLRFQNPSRADQMLPAGTFTQPSKSRFTIKERRFNNRDLIGNFLALHFRRGDFAIQFPQQVASTKKLLMHYTGLFQRALNRTQSTSDSNLLSSAPHQRFFPVYLSTDDSTGELTHTLEELHAHSVHFKVYRTGDMVAALMTHAQRTQDAELLEVAGNPNFYGPIEQMICYAASAFVGSYLSTFSGYIHRLRAYHPTPFITAIQHAHSILSSDSIDHDPDLLPRPTLSANAFGTDSADFDENMYFIHMPERLAAGDTNASWIEAGKNWNQNARVISAPFWAREYWPGQYPFEY